MQALLGGKVIVVTAAGAGVGKGIAIEAARQGARVIVNDLGVAMDCSGASAAPAQQTVDEILAFGGTASANTQSVADWKSACPNPLHWTCSGFMCAPTALHRSRSPAWSARFPPILLKAWSE